MKKKHFSPIFWIFLFLTTSCISDFDLQDVSTEIYIDESLVLPIGEGKVDIEDILIKFGLPKSYDTLDNQISYFEMFKYEYSYKNLNVADTIKPFKKTIFLSPIPFTINPNFSFTFPLFDATVDLSVNLTESTEERVDSVFINSALMNVQIDVSPDLFGVPASAFRVEFIFPEDMFRLESRENPVFEPIGYGQTGSIPIGKFAMLLNGANSIPFKIKVYMKPQFNEIQISPTSNIVLTMNFDNVDLSVAYGLFKFNIEEHNTYSLPISLDDYLPDTLLNFADPKISYLPNSLLRFANPKLDVTATTNAGLDFNLKVDYFKAYNTANPENVFEAMFFDPVSGTKNKFIFDTFSGPTVLGQFATKKFSQFNAVNGEFDKVFDNKPYPDMLDYKVTVTSNANRISNFITKDNKLRLDFKASIPIQLKGGSQFTLTDTIHNLDIGDILDNVDSAVLVLKIKNGLPLKAKYRMTYWKSELPNDTIKAIGGTITTIATDYSTGNLTSAYVLNSPAVSADGSVVGIESQSIKIILNKSQIEALKLARFILYSIEMGGDETDNNGVKTPNYINFSTKNSFGVQLGIFIKGNGVVNLFNN